MRNPGMLLDATVKAGGTLSLDIPEEFNAFCYVSDGSGTINKKGGERGQGESNLGRRGDASA